MSRIQCEECNAARGVAEYNNGSYCFSCGHRTNMKSLIPKKDNFISIDSIESLTDIFPKEVDEWLNKYYIYIHIRMKYNILWSPQLQRIIFPVRTGESPSNTIWARSISPNSNSKWLFIGDSKEKYYFQRKTKGAFSKVLYIVEDAISAIRISEYSDCFALCGTSTNYKHIVKLIKKYKYIVIWLDGDNAGREAAYKFYKRYKLICNMKILTTPKDPKCHTPNEISLFC